MEPLNSAQQRYNRVAMFLHWTIAALIIVMIAVGLTMEDYPISIRFLAFNLHKATGLTILALSVFRLVWRLMNPPPVLPAHMPVWEKVAANLSHWALYAFIIVMPLSGWLMVSASAKYPIEFFGLGEAPFIPMPANSALTKQIGHSSDLIHYYLGLGAIALILLHAAAALKHHYIDRDPVFLRMLPRFITRKMGNA